MIICKHGNDIGYCEECLQEAVKDVMRDDY